MKKIKRIFIALFMLIILICTEVSVLATELSNQVGISESIPASAGANPFTDVKETDYFYNPVLWAVESNITAGISQNIFGPNMDCTRSQVVTFLWRASGKPEPHITSLSFVDVPKNAYYYKAVLWAVENNITSGYNASVFGAEDQVTRSQFVTFLWRSKGRPEPSAFHTSFTDIAADAFYYMAVLWAVENGVTAGYYGSLFAPDISCTRGQVVSFLYRARNVVEEEPIYYELTTVQKYNGKIYTTLDVPEDSGIVKIGDGSYKEFIIYRDYVYYKDSSIYREKLDGTAKEQISSMFTYPYSNFVIYNNYLYYGFMPAEMSASDVSLRVNLSNLKSQDTLRYFVNKGNEHVWLVSSDAYSNDKTHYYCQPGQSNAVQWTNSYEPWDVYGEYVFYCAKTSIMKVHKNDIGNSSKEEVVAGPGVITSDACILGHGLYYTKDGDDFLYRTDLRSGEVTTIDIYEELSLESWEPYELHNEINGKLYATGEYGDGSIVFKGINILGNSTDNDNSGNTDHPVTNASLKKADAFYEYNGQIYTFLESDYPTDTIKLSFGTCYKKMIIHEGYVYYIEADYDDIVGPMYRCKIDGTERTQIFAKADNLQDFCIYQDKLYCFVLGDTSLAYDLDTQKIIQYHYQYIDGSEDVWLVKRLINGEYYYCDPGYENLRPLSIGYEPLGVYNDYILYCTDSSIMKIHKNDIGNLSKAEVIADASINTADVQILGDGVYFTKNYEYGVYRKDLRNGNVLFIDIYEELSLDIWNIYELHSEINGMLYVTGEYDDQTNVLAVIPVLRDNSISDGKYAVAFDTDSLTNKNGELYLSFEYYKYDIHRESEILNLKVGDTITYDGTELVVRNFDVDSWYIDGIKMYSVYVNYSDISGRYQAGYMTDRLNPGMMKEIVTEGGDAYPLYNYIDTITLKMNKNACLYVQNNPGEEFETISYDNIVDYCLRTDFSTSPLQAELTVVNNEITKIEEYWIP